MRRFLSSSFVMLALLAISFNVQAQVFYTQDFSGGGLPPGWSTTDASGNGIVWEYCSGPSSACVDLYSQEEFASTTASNGFLVMDSDAGGDLPSNHISRVTSSAINCSAANQVFAIFQNYVGVFTVPSDGAVLLKASTDGTNWTTYNFIPGLDVSNRFSADPQIATVDISAVAANQATVYLQWEWTGNYEYWWMLDDVSLTTQDPTPANDLTLSRFFYPPSSFATPESQIGTDTFGFYGYVTNNGIATQTNVELKAEVLDVNGAVVFADSASIASLEPGYVDSLIELPNQFAPELTQGVYSIRYTVSADGTDAFPTDNVDGDDFFISDFLYSKDNAPVGALRPGSGGDYAAANLYTISPAILDNYIAVGYQVSAATNASDGTIGDFNASAYLFKVNDDILDDWSNFEDADLFSPSLEWVGEGSLDFPDGATNYTLYPVILSDVATGAEGVPLVAGARYFAAMGYSDASNVVFQAYSDETSHFFVSSMVYTTAWFLGGFGEDYNPTIRMVIDLATSVDNNPLPESAMTVFPNPAKDVVNLDVQFDQPTNATITIAELSGRVINIDNRKGLTNETLSYPIQQLAAGTYLARIATETGTKTKKFVVVK